MLDLAESERLVGSPYASTVKKTLKLREEIVWTHESRPLPEAPVIGHEYHNTCRGWCREASTNEGGITEIAHLRSSSFF